MKPTMLHASPDTLGCNPRHFRMQPPTLSDTTPDTFAKKCILSPCESVYSQHAKEYTLRTRKSIHFPGGEYTLPIRRVYSPSAKSILFAPQSVGGLGQEGGAGRQGGADIAFPGGGVWHNDRIIENLPASGGAQTEHRRARQRHRSKFHSHSARSFQNSAYYPISRHECKRKV